MHPPAVPSHYGRILLVALAATLAACSKAPPPLPADLQAIRCPDNKPAHASASFAKGRVTFVCLAKELADAPHLLRCDLESSPMICEDAGSLVFSRGPDGPPRSETFEEVETDWRFMIPEVSTLLPPGFTLAKGALCDRQATVLNSATCNLEARSASLYWHIAVSYLAEPGTPVTAEEYQAEMEHWLNLLGQLVTDPVK